MLHPHHISPKSPLSRFLLPLSLLLLGSAALLAPILHAAPATDDGPPLRSPHAYALCIGINYESVPPNNKMGISPLHSAANDSSAVADALSNNYGFNSVIRLEHEFPTRERILKALDTDLNKLGPDDTLFIFYAGHGFSHSFPRQNEPDLQQGYIIPVDCSSPPPQETPQSYADTFISMQYLANRVRDNKNGRHIILCLDCCFSGFALESRNINPQTARNYRALMTNPSRLVMTAGTEDQKSYESNGHGLFTTSLLAALNKRVQNKAPACATELYDDLRDSAKTLANDHDCPFNPQMRSLRVKSPIGEIVFLPNDAQDAEKLIASVPEKSSDAPPVSPDQMNRSIADAQTASDSGQDKSHDPQAQKSYADYNQRASAGDPNAMAVLHYYDHLGYGTPKNDDAAHVWAADTADAGLPLGQLLLAECFNQGIGVPKNPSLATLLQQRAGPNANAAFTRMGRHPRQQQQTPQPQPSPQDFMALGTAIGDISSRSGAGAHVSTTLDKDLRKKIIQVIKHHDDVKEILDDLDKQKSSGKWTDLNNNITDWNKAVNDLKTAAASTPQAADVAAITSHLQAAISTMRGDARDLLPKATRLDFVQSDPEIVKLQSLGRDDPSSPSP